MRRAVIVLGCAAACSVALAAQSPRLRPNERVRITTADVVELPGVVKLEPDATYTNVVLHDRESVTVRQTTGEFVTVARPRTRVVGSLDLVDVDRVTLRREKGSAVIVPRVAVVKLEISAGRHSRWKSALFGFLIGAGGGSLIGWAVGNACPKNVPFGCFLSPAVEILGGIIVGGGAGAVVGALLPGEAWTSVPVDWLEK